MNTQNIILTITSNEQRKHYSNNNFKWTHVIREHVILITYLGHSQLRDQILRSNSSNHFHHCMHRTDSWQQKHGSSDCWGRSRIHLAGSSCNHPRDCKHIQCYFAVQNHLMKVLPHTNSSGLPVFKTNYQLSSIFRYQRYLTKVMSFHQSISKLHMPSCTSQPINHTFKMVKTM